MLAQIKLDDAIILVIETSDYLHRLEANQFNLFTQKLHNSLLKTIGRFEGKIISQNDNAYSVAFISVTDAVLCALKVQSKFKYVTPKFDTSIRKLKIGIAHGGGNLNAHLLATRLCELITDQIVITKDIKTLYEKENQNTFIDREHIKVMTSSEVSFLTNLMNYIETVWNDSNFKVDELPKVLGYSRSQVYRKTVALTGKAPSHFIRDFRLNRALFLLRNKKGNISEIAAQTGFGSATYFSKCFKERFKILPSKYIRQHIH